MHNIALGYKGLPDKKGSGVEFLMNKNLARNVKFLCINGKGAEIIIKSNRRCKIKILQADCIVCDDM